MNIQRMKIVSVVWGLLLFSLVSVLTVIGFIYKEKKKEYKNYELLIEETAEKYINSCNKGKPATSGDNNLLWTNHYTQRMYYFTRKNKNSKWVLTNYPVKGYKNRSSVKVATGSFAHGTSFKGTVDTSNSKSGHQLYKKNNGFQRIPYYIHKDSPWGSGLHVSGAKKENTLGKPRTHKCVAAPNPIAKWAYYYLHADEKIIDEGGKATRFVDW